MKAFVFALLLLGAGCRNEQGWESFRGTLDPSSARNPPAGPVVGLADGLNVQAWLGLPYAAPPVGALRWKAPRSYPTWQTPREALKYGSVCPQLANMLGAKGAEGTVVGQEDCLTLSVFAPKAKAEDAPGLKRPVMFWIHGGGNTIGTGSSYGAIRNLTQEYGVVAVTVNYRLGVFGWLSHPALAASATSPEDASGNFGTLDLIAALRWVHDNIATFGGDPNDVMVFGESAGGFDTFALLAAPSAHGLFQRALVESGLPASHTLAQARNFVDDAEPGDEHSSNEMLVKLLQHDHANFDRAAAKAQLAKMSPAEIERYLRAKSAADLITPLRGALFGMYRWPAVLADGTVIPSDGVAAALPRSRKAHPVPVVLGTNRDEYKLFMAQDPRYVKKTLGLLPHPRDPARYALESAEVSDVWRAAGVDLPAKALADVGGAGVFSYRFDWDREPSHLGVNLSQLLGAAHGLEIGFVFRARDGQMDPLHLQSPANRAGREALSRAMASYWVQFAKTGDPGQGLNGELPRWESYTGAHPRYMVLNAPESGGVHLAEGAGDLDQLGDRIWLAPGHTDDERCKAYGELMHGFAGPAGIWTPARAQAYAKRCPGTPAWGLPR